MGNTRWLGRDQPPRRKTLLPAQGQNPIPLQADTDTNLFTTVLNLELKLTRDTNGVVTSVTCDQSGRQFELKRKTALAADQR